MVCQFYNKAEHLQCSEDNQNLTEHAYEEIVIICTECGLLPSPTHILNICSNHFSYFLDLNTKRKRRQYCEIPFLINCHKQYDVKRKSDRTLSLSNVVAINGSYGVVLPVGTGQLLKWNDLGSPSKTSELKTIADWIEREVMRTHEEGREEVESDADSAVLECPNESCTKKFSSKKAVDQHILMGNCDLLGVKMNISEKAKRLYAQKIISIQPQRSVYIESANHNSASSSLKMGWTIKEIKQRANFSQRQKDFMTEKFQIGKVTGNKIDPFVAAEEMRKSGKYRKSEFLSGHQISSFFSRLCRQEKKMTEEDYAVAKEEDRKCNIKNVLLKSNKN